MAVPFKAVLGELMPFDQVSFEGLVSGKLRPSYDRQGLYLLRERAKNERNLRELYRMRAPYELLQNADDAGCKHAAFVVLPNGLAFLHDGEWFSVRDFENLALGWSNKNPDICIGNKGLGFRSVLDVSPAPHLLRLNSRDYFGVRFSYALNRGHIEETLRRSPELRDEVRRWGPGTCPIMSIPGVAKRQGLDGGVISLLDGGARQRYGSVHTTLIWLPAADSEIALDVLRELSPSPITTAAGVERLHEFISHDVPDLILFLRNVVDVRLYVGAELVGQVAIAAGTRSDHDLGKVVTTIDEVQSERSYFQARKSIPIPSHIRNDPQTSGTLRSMKEARVALLVELVNGRPQFSSTARFHVYFPTEESTGVGFVVHGDFYVKPDRSRLMSGVYNNWLYGEAAALAAGSFLTDLLRIGNHRETFEALRPVKGVPGRTAAHSFVAAFGAALKIRRKPFIPTRNGDRLPSEVFMPRLVDEGGIWDRLVGEALSKARPGRVFVEASSDSADVRSFLQLTGVEELPADAFLDLIEVAGRAGQTADWWFACYRHLTEHRELSHWGPNRFEGREVVPVIGGSLARVAREDDQTVLILPPRGGGEIPEPPPAFAPYIQILESAVAERLWAADESVRSWIASRLRASTFEVTDFLPRVIQIVAPQLFRNSGNLSNTGLARVWEFVRASAVAAGRPITDERFWESVARLPVPVAGPSRTLAPAFLTFFPDAWIGRGAALFAVAGLRRVDKEFLDALVDASGSGDSNSWRQLLARAGVSTRTKILTYRRIVPGALRLLAGPVSENEVDGRFEGHRQADENRAVLGVLTRERLWDELLVEAPRCMAHPNQSGLASLTVIDSLACCAATALEEHEKGDPTWSTRLRDLSEALGGQLDVAELETVCQSCRTQTTKAWGASTQLSRYRWVPTSFGPWTKEDSFLRLSGHRLVGLEPGTDKDNRELGDKLLPYVVANGLSEYQSLIGLGIQKLDDAADASTDALIGFLVAVGRAMAPEGAAAEVLPVRSRWRLVRGAIQEAYRSLNRREDLPAVDGDMRLATRTTKGPAFKEAPWYFAEPGSLIERAFQGHLNLIDADRNYASLFGALGVVQLASGAALNEKLVLADGDEEAPRLRTQIVESLAPYLLALVAGRGDTPQHVDLVVRRLLDRFYVRVATSLSVRLELTQPPLKSELSVSPFYLDRTIVEVQGRREAAYTLYVVGQSNDDLWALDGDALGVALSPVFLDGASDELAPQFPRVVTRFQRAQADAALMKPFLLETLGVSLEAQELAHELLAREPLVVGDGQPGPPTVLAPSGGGSSDGDLSSARDAALAGLKSRLERDEADIASRLGAHKGSSGSATQGSGLSGHGETRITRDQEVRGKRGEEEMKRRLEGPEGWGGLQLLRDTRDDGCGYDFLCAERGEEVKLEVKTFIPGGRVVITLRELQEAYASRERYYLLGLIDDGHPSTEWRAVIRKDPIEHLLKVGSFELDAKLEATAEKLFPSQSDGS
jgi:hypothetical protein